MQPGHSFVARLQKLHILIVYCAKDQAERVANLSSQGSVAVTRCPNIRITIIVGLTDSDRIENFRVTDFATTDLSHSAVFQRREPAS